MNEVAVGILGFQGDVEEHLAALKNAFKSGKLSGSIKIVKKAGDLDGVEGLCMPGGESTVIGSLAREGGVLEALRSRIEAGMPILATCAGLIMLAKRTYDRVVGETSQPTLGVMDIVVERNSFGRQRESFEADLDIPILGDRKFRGVFIRAPSVREAGQNVRILAKLNDVIVAVQQGSILGTCFHAELTDDPRLHNHFLNLVAGAA